MKKFWAILAIFSLVLVGCGKKKDSTHKKDKETTQHKASLDNVGGDYVILDEEAPELEDFAFVDENPKKDEKNNSKQELLAGNNVDLETKLEEFDLGDESLSFGEEDEKCENVLFGFNEDDPLKTQNVIVKENVEKAKVAVESGKKVSLSGHACQIGSPDYNMALSLRRANTIKKEMLASGIKSDKIVTIGCGQESPIVESNAEDEKTRISELSPNRRVEVAFVTN